MPPSGVVSRTPSRLCSYSSRYHDSPPIYECIRGVRGRRQPGKTQLAVGNHWTAERAVPGAALWPGNDRQRDVRRMGRVVNEPLVRDDERAVTLVVAARIEIAVVLREKRG